MKFTPRYLLAVVPAILLLTSPSVALAHVGVSSTTSLWGGFAHPLSGLDHICAMLGVGIWAAQRGGRATWLVPAVFVLVMTAGSLFGILGVSVPFVETGIVASVLILGVLIAAAVRFPLAVSSSLVALFALCHGHAHGAEMPATAAGLMYGVGFIAATSCLLACGSGLAAAAHRYNSAWIARCAGAAMIVCAVGLCVSRLS